MLKNKSRRHKGEFQGDSVARQTLVHDCLIGVDKGRVGVIVADRKFSRAGEAKLNRAAGGTPVKVDGVIIITTLRRQDQYAIPAYGAALTRDIVVVVANRLIAVGAVCYLVY